MKFYQNLFPSISALIAFERAAQLGSFQAASEELNRTPSAISHAIQDIELRLGTKLFDREGRGIRLNPYGESYYRVVCDALESLDNVGRRIANKESSKSISVSVSPFFASAVLIPNLQHYEENFPDIELQIVTNNQYVDLLNGDVDLAIRAGGNNNDLHVVKLVEARAITICSRSILEDSSAPLKKIDDLEHHTLISIKNIKQAWPTWLHDQGLSSLKPKRLLEFDTTLGALDAVKSGLGIGLGIYPLIKGHSDYLEKIVSPFESMSNQSMTYNAVCRKEDAQLEKIANFTSWVSKVIDRL